MAGREFTSAQQSLSSDIFVKTMCLRTWMKPDMIRLPRDRQKAAIGVASTYQPDESVDAVMGMIET